MRLNYTFLVTITMFAFLVNFEGFAQKGSIQPLAIGNCSGYELDGPSTVCVGSYYQYGVSGGTVTSVTGITLSGGGTLSGSTITWGNVAATYTVRFATNCGEIIQSVSVVARPTPTITDAKNGLGSTGCTQTYSTQTGKTSYSWGVSAGGTLLTGAGTSSITVRWNTAGAQSVQVNYTSGGCRAVTSTVRAVTVSQTASPTFVQVPPAECVDDGYTHAYKTETGMTAYNWTISPTGQLGSGQGTSTAQVFWNSQGPASVSVYYTNTSGCVTPAAVRNLTVGSGLSVNITGVTGATSVCENTTVRYTVNMTPTGITPTWSGYNTNLATVALVAGTTNQFDVTYKTITPLSAPVQFNISPTGLCVSGASYSLPVTIYKTPSVPISLVSYTTVCQNFMRTFRVGTTNTQQVIWSTGAGYSIVSRDNGSNSDADITFTTPGTYTITATPVNGPCQGPAKSFTVTVPNEAATLKTVSHSHTNLINSAVKPLYLNRCADIYGDCPKTLTALRVYAKLDAGKTFDLGKASTFSASVVVTVRGFDAADTQLFSKSATLTINATSPEQLLYFEETNATNLSNVRRIDITPSSYVNPLLTTQVRLVSYYEEDFTFRATATLSPNPLVVSAGNTTWEQTLSWTVNNANRCNPINTFLVQMIKQKLDARAEPKAYITPTASDWNNALSMVVNGTSVKVTMAEGDGQYSWRVKPISGFAGGITNPDNLTADWATATFLFYQPEDSKNWIYNRTFTEGNKLSEQLTYANGLQQVSQQQFRTQTQGFITGSQTLRDLAGRDALTTLPIPVKDPVNPTMINSFGYRPNLLSSGSVPFNAGDFDSDSKIANPTNALDEGGYYSGVDKIVTINGQSVTINTGVPSSENIPYTRQLFTSDGTGRIQVQAGVGLKNSLKGGKTIRTFYSGASEEELVAMFGSEAPANASVLKITTADANNTASVTYQNKDGKVLATALSKSAATNLLPVGTAPATSPNIIEVVKVKVPMANGFRSEKPLFFTEAVSSVKIDYEITPAAIASFCNSACSTCDYKIVRLLHTQDPITGVKSSVKLDSLNIGRGKDLCTAGKATFPQASFTALPFTQYVVEVRVTSSPGVGPNGKPYAEEYTNDAIVLYQTAVTAALASVRADLSTNNVKLLYTNLNAQKTAGTYLYDDAKAQFVIPISSCESNLPDGTPTCDVQWKEKTPGVKFQGENIVWPTGGGGKAVTYQQLAINKNGWIEMTVIDTDKFQSFGFSNPGNTAGAVGFGFSLNYELTVTEGGVEKAMLGRYNPGDVLRVERVGGTTIQYRRNGKLLYTSLVSSTTTLAGHIYFSGFSGFSNPKVSFCTPEYITIPDNRTCTDETVNPTTKKITINGVDYSFSQYFNLITGKVFPENQYFYWKNNTENVIRYFTAAVFDQMMINLLADHQTVPAKITDQELWDIWKAEVSSYSSWNNPANIGTSYSMNGIALTVDRNLYNRLMSRVEQKIYGKRDPNQTANCYAGNVYFMYKAFRYGSGSGVTLTQPDLNFAYRFIYYNEGNAWMKKTHDNFLIAKSKGTFDALTPCEKVEYAKAFDNGVFTGDPANQITPTREAIIDKCGEMCEARAEEFRQAIINAIFTQNSNAKIEHYRVTKNAVTNQWVGVPDVTVNDGITTNYMDCEIESMVQGLINNCKSKYCTVTQTTVNGQTQLGTAAEQANISKVLNNKFNIQVKPSGQTCGTGWDQVIPAPVTGVVRGVVLPTNITDGFVYGAIFTGETSTDASFDQVYVVNNNNDSGAGSFRDAITLANTFSNANPSKTILIRFNIALPTPIQIPVANEALSISAANLTIDATTQPGFNPENGSAIRLDFSSLLADWASFFVNANRTTIKGLDLKNNMIYAGGNDLNIIGNRVQGIFITEGNNVVVKGNLVGVDFSFNVTSTLGYIGLSECQGVTIGGTNDEANIVAKRIYLKSSSTSRTQNVLIENNRIVSFDSEGILMGASYLSTVLDVTVSRNLMMMNPLTTHPNPVPYRIDPVNATVDNISTSTITTTSIIYSGGAWNVVGTSLPNSTIELFIGHMVSGLKMNILKHVASVIADSNGNWSATGVQLIPNEWVAVSSSLSGYTTSDLPSWSVSPTPACTAASALCFQWDAGLGPVVVPVEFTPYKYDPQVKPCNEIEGETLTALIDAQVARLVDIKRQQYMALYKTTCMDPTKFVDKFQVQYSNGLHHHTLYYYDRAGNLIRTVPPEGVVLHDVTDQAKFLAAKAIPNPHKMVTYYEYNSLGQLVRQHTPDANGTSVVRPPTTDTEAQRNSSQYFSTSLYNDKGQLRFSRNAEQKTDGRFSYIKYDNLGRVVEVGEATGYDEPMATLNRNNNSYPAAGKFVTKTFYSVSVPGTKGYAALQNPDYLLNRISYTYIDDDGNDATTTDQHYTVYSYDPHGNVDVLIQDIAGFRPVVMNYKYDLLTGNITKVSYNPGKDDQFYHRYTFDADNRIDSVFTSRDGILWERDAWYQYYAHGPLKRTVIGDDEVQGVDYTYTIHGWLKGINAPFANLDADLNNRDGVAGKTTANDAYGMELGYYLGDYVRSGSVFDDAYLIGGQQTNFRSTSNVSDANDLYNGNISTWVNYNPATGGSGFAAGWDGITSGSRYRYDDLNRIRSEEIAQFSTSWGASNLTSKYASEYKYLPPAAPLLSNGTNGNLQNLKRYNATVLVDDINYSYTTGTGANNRLNSVVDVIGATPSLPTDLESTSTFGYDAIGNITSDNSGGTARTITWTPYGKVKAVATNGTTGPTFNFTYDATGNRIAKVTDLRAGTVTTDYYVRDATGNIMAVYTKTVTGAVTTNEILEQPLFGSDRLGSYSYRRASAGSSVAATTVYGRLLNYKRYELKDHLDNVRALVTDQKIRQAGGNFTTDMVGVNNYYPFGMLIYDRTWAAGIEKYRYGYNGKEKDTNGEFGLTSYDYGFRIYNPAIARFLSVDPLTKSYPELTPYQFASNRPIDGIDLDGLEWQPVVQRSVALAQRAQPYLQRGWQAAARYVRQGGQAAAQGFNNLHRSIYYGTRTGVNKQIQDWVAVNIQGYAPYAPDVGNLVYGAITDDPNEPFPSNNPLSSDVGSALTKLFRGTMISMELQIFKETGYILSDAARIKYLETGSIDEAMKYANEVHQQWLKIFDGDINKYAEAHSRLGIELSEKYGLPRTLISSTEVEETAKYFSGKGGEVFGGLFPSANTVKQTLGTSTETETLIIGGTQLFKKKE